MQDFPVVKWASRHPRLAAWFVLGLGMVAFLIFEARDVGLLPTQWLSLIVATILVAGLCVWIISWEDAGEEEPASSSTPAPDSE